MIFIIYFSNPHPQTLHFTTSHMAMYNKKKIQTILNILMCP